MILLSSNAQNIFWLGRYLTRIQYLCSQFPFQHDQDALSYAHAFCLPAFDACSLNELVVDQAQPISFYQQFQSAKNNIHDLRGVLSSQSFAALNQLLKQAEKNTGYICDVCSECNEVLDSEEDESVFLFFSFGQKIEQLDRQIRLGQDSKHTLKEINGLVLSLNELGLPSLIEEWSVVEQQPNSQAFYQFCDHVESLFEMDYL